MTTEIIPREKCHYCNVYLPKGCLNDICLKCSKKRKSWMISLSNYQNMID